MLMRIFLLSTTLLVTSPFVFADYYTCQGYKDEIDVRSHCLVERLNVPANSDESSFSWADGCGVTQVMLLRCTPGSFDPNCRPGEIDIVFKVGPNNEDETWNGQSKVRLGTFPAVFTLDFQQSPPSVEAQLRCVLHQTQ